MKTTRVKSITGKIYGHEIKTGRNPSPAEVKAQRVCITLTPQARKRGLEIAKSRGVTFSALVADMIYTETV